MAIQSMQLDPNAASYSDDEIVGKVNAAAANISRANAVESTAVDLSGKDSDDLSEGAANKYDTGAPPSDLDSLPDGAARKAMSDTEKTKLTEIEEGADVNPTDDETVAAINAATDPITREDALSQDDLKIVKTNPITGEFQVKNIHRQADGKLDVEFDDVPES